MQVVRATEQILIPERGAILGNFGTSAITQNESWVTDAEYMVEGKFIRMERMEQFGLQGLFARRITNNKYYVAKMARFSGFFNYWRSL